MKGIKNKNLICTVTVLIFVLLTSLIFTAFYGLGYAQTGSAAADTTKYTITPGEFDCYTDSEYLYNPETGLNESESVYGYAAHLKELYSNVVDTVPADDWLFKTIPEVLFQHPGEYFYAGKKYAFYLKAMENNKYFFYILRVDIYRDLDHGGGLENGHFGIGISPIAYNYCSYNAETGQLGAVLTGYPSSDGRTEISSYNRMSIKRVYIKDVGFTAALSNKFHNNQGDIDYIPDSDNGQFFIGTQYKLDAVSLSDAEEYNIQAAKIVLGAITSPVPILGMLVGAGLFVWDIVDLATSYVAAAEKDFREEIIMGQDSSFQLDAISKPQQIEKYGRIKKIASAGIQSSMEQPALLTCGMDTYAGCEFFINETELWESLLNVGLSIDIVEENGTIEVTSSSDYVENIASDVVSTPISFTRRQGEEEPVVLVENTESVNYSLNTESASFTFTASRTGLYSLKYNNSAGAEADIRLFHNGSEIAFQNGLASGDKLVNLMLQQDAVYTIKLCNYVETPYIKYSLTVEFTPQTLCEGNNTLSFNSSDTEYMTFTAPQFMYYNFLSTEAEVDVFQLDFTPYESSEGILLAKDQTVYLKLSLPEATTADITVSFEKYKNINFNWDGVPAAELKPDEEFDFPVLEAEGKEFLGWKLTEDGGIVTVSDLWEYDSGDIYLIADWRILEYTISFDENGGSEVEDIIYTVQTPLFYLYDENDISKTDYSFVGWYDASGAKVDYVNSGSTGNIYLTAKWIKTKQLVTLDVNAAVTFGNPASIEYSEIELTYGEDFVLPVPVAAGFTFNGWYLDNKQYTDADGNSLIAYSEEDGADLVAHWSIKTVTVKVVVNVSEDGTQYEKAYWIGSGGTLSESETSVQYFTQLCPHCIIQDAYEQNVFNEPGKIYYDLVSVSGDIEGCWSVIFPDVENGQTVELRPTFIDEEYTIDFLIFSELDFPEMHLNYGDVYSLSGTPITGYDVNNWIVADYNKNSVFDGTLFERNSVFAANGMMPDLSVNSQGNAVIYLTPTPKTYNVTLKNEAGISQAVYTATYAQVLSGVLPLSKAGYTFLGWYNGEVKVINSNGFSCDAFGNQSNWTFDGNITLTAKFQANQYKIFYKYDNTTVTVSYNTQVKLKNVTRTGYDGYWVFEGRTLPMGSTIQYTYTKNIEVNAKWEARSYNIYYVSDRSDSVFPTISYTYGSETVIREPSNRYGDEFGGYFNNSSFSGARVTSISKERTGDITLYVKWNKLYLGSYSRSYSLAITKNEYDRNPCDELAIGLGYIDYDSNYNYLYFEVTLDINEKYDGYQIIYLYLEDNNLTEINRILKSTEIEHGPGEKLSTTKSYVWKFCIELSKIQNQNELLLKYGARGSGWNEWNCASVSVDYYLTHNQIV